jgi:glucokinase
MDLGPRTDRDRALWPHLDTIGGRISAEWIISGPGLQRLYEGLARSRGVAPALSRPEEISSAGLAGSDPLAVECLELFATYLGRYAGDVALTFMATGGVFIGGGIAPTLAPILQNGAFRTAFADKAPHSDIVSGFATAIIGFAAPAILGMAALLREPDSYAVGLEGRRWTK